MNKRDAVLSLLDSSNVQSYIPAAFFLHFDPVFHTGQAAVEKHLEYFKYTGMDFVKIQYEGKFPSIPTIQKPEDWAKMPCYGLDFYEPQLKVVEGLVKAAKKDALVVVTSYSPFMCAGHTAGEDTVTRHILENPQAVQRGMQTITDSLMGFVKACAKLGLDGFYTSTQGGEADRLPGRELFDQCVRPYDLELMDEVNRLCGFNILHVCDYRQPYNDLHPYINYPGQIVNCSLELSTGKTTSKEVSRLFNRPYMGGLDRLGILAKGTMDEVCAAAVAMLKDAPARFILAADCTVPSETPWENLKAAIDTAHQFRR